MSAYLSVGWCWGVGGGGESGSHLCEQPLKSISEEMEVKAARMENAR